ncbi:MAG: hypothetical protein M1837_002852 [Sclerophora amabilis]|nr:MAG: hypothetical protein M1837_002852 [Sclerophora amabilis]
MKLCRVVMFVLSAASFVKSLAPIPEDGQEGVNSGGPTQKESSFVSSPEVATPPSMVLPYDFDKRGSISFWGGYGGPRLSDRQAYQVSARLWQLLIVYCRMKQNQRATASNGYQLEYKLEIPFHERGTGGMLLDVHITPHQRPKIEHINALLAITIGFWHERPPGNGWMGFHRRTFYMRAIDWRGNELAILTLRATHTNIDDLTEENEVPTEYVLEKRANWNLWCGGGSIPDIDVKLDGESDQTEQEDSASL